MLTSLGDFNAHIEYNRNPIDDMIRLLETFFNPSAPEKGFSLEINQGMNGSKLSHSHGTQYTFVLQSLHLWREIAQVISSATLLRSPIYGARGTSIK